MIPTGPRPSFGRTAERARVQELLHAPGARLVTLVGRSGVGKTHLAEGVARTWDDGRAVVVPLAEVAAPDEVLPEIARRLGIPLLPAADPVEAMALAVGDRPALLVLDNVEHLLPAVADVGRLLDRAPALRVLATSQVALRLAHEQVVVVEPLPLPDPDAAADALAAEPAVALYAARAAAADGRFALTPENAPAVAALCRALEGLPLAIELAAARSAMLPAADILARLDAAPLGPLAARRGDHPERHLTLRSAIERTCALLAPDEWRLLRRLTVFATSFTLADVEAVGVASDGEAGDVAVVIDRFESLVDFHLVDPVPQTLPARFALPSAIRAYAAERLEALGERRGALADAARWAARRAVGLLAELTTGDENAALREIADESDNLVAAMDAALETGLVDEAIDIAIVCARQGVPSARRPGLDRLLAPALAAARQRRTGQAAHLAALHALLVFNRGDAAHTSEIVDLLDDAEAMARETGHDAALLAALTARVICSPVTHDAAGAARAVAEGLALAKAVRDDRATVRFELLAGAMRRLGGEEDAALALITSALRRAQRARYDGGVVAAGAVLRPYTLDHPELAGIAPSTAELVALARRIDMPWYDVALLPLLVIEALDAASEGAGDGSAVDGNAPVLKAARAHLAEALARARACGTPSLQGFALVAASRLAAVEGDGELAAVLHGAVDPVRERVVGTTLSLERARQQDASMEAVERALGRQAFAVAVGRGARLALDDALALAQERLVAAPAAAAADAVPPTGEALPAGAGVIASPPDPAATAPVPLTPRQEDVLRLLAQGMRNKEIAARLYLSPRTVGHHCIAIYQQLGVRGRSEATAWAVRRGLADPAPTVR